MKLTRTETGNAPVDQLYNLKKDRGEKENLAEKYPEKVKDYESHIGTGKSEY